MNLAEGGGQVAIDSHHEGHARDSRNRAADTARVAHRDQNSREDAQESDLQRQRKPDCDA